jgi:hypothetical protein
MTAETTETEAIGRYECPACPARFETVGDKKHHVREEHGYRKGGRRG